MLAYGTNLGGYLTRRFLEFANPGRYAMNIADDILEKIETEDKVPGHIKSTHISFSRPKLASAPFLAAN